MSDKYRDLLDGLKRPLPDALKKPAGPLLSEEELTAMETQLGQTLPGDYRDFLRYLPTHGDFQLDSVEFQYMGQYGQTEGWVSGFDENPVRSYFLFSKNLRIDPFPADCLRGLRLVRDMAGVEFVGWPEEFLPIAWDQGLNMICLAISGFRPYAVFWFRSNPNDMGDSIYFVANSFDEFMHLLRKGE